jgi:acetate kinase
MRVLVVNTGSSSVKLSVVEPDGTVADRAELAVEDGVLDRSALLGALRGMPAPDAVGHRVVHGGGVFTAPVRLDADARRRIADLADLAPLHQPASLAGIAAIDDVLPGVPAVACFDTAFHASLPPEAATYPIPEAWRRTYRIRRYGFHGLSHAYASRRAAESLGRDRARRVVTAHLGAGASLAAVLDGRSVDTTMGFTPLEGLAMATRSGSIDPGLVVWLTGHAGLSTDDVSHALEHGSGLAGLAGTGDMREVLARADRGDAGAELALGVYLHRLRAGIAEMAAALDGLDALVFTGGVGENAPRVRARCAAGLGFLGVAVDEAANDAVTGDADVSAGGASVATLVVAAREDLEIAAGVRTALAARGT